MIYLKPENMIKYRHDYTTAETANNIVFVAMINSDDQDVIDMLRLAHEHLDKYVKDENIIEAKNAPGFILDKDAFKDEELLYIRELVGVMLKANPCSEHANTWLSIINTCQKQLGCPVFWDIDIYLSNKSNSWAKIEL